jgi:hypothetical protein
MTRRAKPGKRRTTKHPSSLRFLLLTGVPGTGKTTLGNYLRESQRFRHLDFEDMQTLGRYLGDGLDGLSRRVEKLRQGRRDVVITWGFLPDPQLPYVLELRRLGFDWVWLDGDRDAARRVFLERGTVSEELLDAQLTRISTLDFDALAPTTVNPFDDTGNFRPLEEIAADLP